MRDPRGAAVEILKALVPYENATRDQVRRFIAHGVRPHLPASPFDRYELDPMGNLIALKAGHRIDLPPLVLLAYGMDFQPGDMADPYEPKIVDGGPHVGTRVKADVMLAGSDRVAIDAVGVAILRLLGTTPQVSQGKIFEQEQIKRAAELGLGVKSADQIEVVTGDKESEAYARKVREVLAKG